jgi:hypothetical protein
MFPKVNKMFPPLVHPLVARKFRPSAVGVKHLLLEGSELGWLFLFKLKNEHSKPYRV